MQHLKDFTTTSWSGGTTTELFIWPAGASYAERNFDFRLSTATVEIEESDFTPLEGVQRTLMVLEGEMELQHEGHHSVKLGPFETDEFEGGWKTHSVGKCRDFNLMCRGNAKGEMTPFSLTQFAEEVLLLNTGYHFIYVVKGALEVGGLSIRTGELLKVEGEQSLHLVPTQHCDFVLVSVV